MIPRAHLSVPAGFIIVSFPDEAADTICCSTDLFILALSAYVTNQYVCQEGKIVPRGGGPLALCMDACLMAEAFFGATVRRPFFVLAAALCARRALLLGLLCPALVVVPWTIVTYCMQYAG